jgi:hypothetical protein
MSCPKGEIRRSSYKRKSYRRNSGKKVSASRVASTCVPAKGKALSRGSKTPKSERVLPKLGKEISLRKFGYELDKPQQERQNALSRASKTFGTLKVEKRLGLIRNYSSGEPKNYKKLSKDMEFMKQKYAAEKRTQSTKPRGGSKRKSRKGSKKTSKKTSRKRSRKGSKRTSKKKSRK